MGTKTSENESEDTVWERRNEDSGEKKGKRVRKISTARLSRGQPTHLRDAKLNSNHAFMEPSVQVRELKKDRVNFVLENVDLSCASIPNNT